MYLIAYKIACNVGNPAWGAIPERRSSFVCPMLLIAAAFVGVIHPPLANAQGPVADSSQLSFEGYPGAPEVSVVPRKDQLFFYPCDQCHAAMEPNPQIRPLDVMHDAEIDHGGGRIWCLSCHDLEERNYLATLLDEPVDFDEAHLVCGGCHAERHRDWAFGVHGKRVEKWQGERTQYDCAHCHNPHNPAIAPRAPGPPPPVRTGLKLERGEVRKAAQPWDRHEDAEQ